LRAWIALAAFVFSLFVPSLSQAFAPQHPAYANEICTAASMVMLPMAASPDQEPGAVPDMSNCDLCCSHHGPVLLLPTPGLPLFVLPARARIACELPRRYASKHDNR
jgi:hypothetical protein